MADEKFVVTEQDEYRTIVEYEKDEVKEAEEKNKVAVSNWFVTICFSHIPVFNIIYFIVLLCSRKTPQPKKTYVLAWVFYQLLCIGMAVVILVILTKVGAGFLDELLKYIPS